VCNECDGAGAPNKSAVKKCGACQGTGMEMLVRQVGPGMIQQQQITCRSCKGEGETIPKDQVCKSCHGKKVVRSPKTLDINVRPGVSNHDTIVFRREAHQEPGIPSGDVIIEVNIEPHPVFKRDGPHLIISRKISMADALSGFQFDLKTLDKRTLKIRSDPSGQSCLSNSVKIVRGEGMPIEGTSRRGDLYIKTELDRGRLPYMEREKVAKLFGVDLPPLVPPSQSGVVLATDAPSNVRVDLDGDESGRSSKKKEKARKESGGEQQQQCAQM